MKKLPLFLLVLCALAFVFTACPDADSGNGSGKQNQTENPPGGNPPGENPTGGNPSGGNPSPSILTLSNSPSGQISAVVYNRTSIPTNYNEFVSMQSIAMASGTSPFTISWFYGIQSGPRVVVITAASLPASERLRFAVVQFSTTGSATANWNSMTVYTPDLY